MKTILVPTDFSPEAAHALDAAIQIAQKTGAGIRLLHVVEIPSGSFMVASGSYIGDSGIDSIYTVQLLESVKENLKDLEERVMLAGVPVTSNLENGNVFQHIHHNITDEEADLIVMGSKGVSGWEELLVGSNTERVIRHSDTPVLTIKGKTNIDEIENIVFAVGEAEDKSVTYVKQFSEALGIKVHLLKVYNTKEWGFTANKSLQFLEKFAKEAGFSNVTFNTIDAMWIEEGILEFTSISRMDMIAMGTRGHTGIIHLLKESAAEGVANHANKPVLTIKIK